MSRERWADAVSMACIIAIIVILALSGCTSVQRPRGWYFDRVRPAVVGEAWRAWVREAAACMETDPPRGAIVWRVARRLIALPSLSQPNGLHFRGRVWIRADHVTHARVIRHETIHYLLLRDTGDSDREHTSDAWRCERAPEKLAGSQ